MSASAGTSDHGAVCGGTVAVCGGTVAVCGDIFEQIAAAGGIVAAGRLRQVCRALRDLSFFACLPEHRRELCAKLLRARPRIYAQTEIRALVCEMCAKSRHSLLKAAVRADNSTFITHFARELQATPAILRAKNDKLFRQAAIHARGGNVLRLLARVCNYTAADARAAGVLVLAAANGNAKFLRILHRRFELGREDARAPAALEPEVMKAHQISFGPNAALRVAVERGHVGVLAVLARDFSLTAADARSINALALAVERGQAGAVEVLASRYALTRADMIARGGAAVRKAIRSNNAADVLCALSDNFGGRPADIRFYNYDALVCAAIVDRPEIIRALMTKFVGRDTGGLKAAILFAAGYGRVDNLAAIIELGAVTAEDARYENNAALIQAAESGNARVIRLLAQTGLTTADARAKKNKAYRKALAAGHTEVLAALAECFGVRD